MEGKPFLVDICLNGVHFVQGPVDSLCLCYGAISERFAETSNCRASRSAPERWMEWCRTKEKSGTSRTPT